MSYLRILALILGLGSGLLASANHVQFHTLAQVDDQHLRFEISWENSWRYDPLTAPGNHDAVWVFFKIRLPGAAWETIALSAADTDHTASPGFEARGVSDRKGVFVQRQSPSEGFTGGIAVTVKLAAPLPLGSADLEAFAIEMVFIPEGPFFIGDGSSFHHFRDLASGGPHWVAGEAPVPAGMLSAGAEAGPVPALPASYPKGYSGFYVMKYEITQGQYRDFLNLLSYEQQAARVREAPHSPAGTYALALNPLSPNRNGIVVLLPGQAPALPAKYGCDANANGIPDESGDGEGRACNFLNWDDLLAYLDWAGLRPVTEWEFEKICRGPEPPLSGEFAWGTPFAVDANTLVMDGFPNETVTESATANAGLASHGYAGPAGPLRNGFGGSASSNRLQAGAGYYGVWELSGNLWELCVAATQAGALFDGSPGDGLLSSQGGANQPSWPRAAGAIHRGGAHNSGIIGPYRDLAVSDRYYFNLQPDLRRNTTGGRGGRTFNP